MLLVAFLLNFSAQPAKAEAPGIVASIKPLHSLLSGVMAGVATPNLLLAGGQSAHTYAMRPSDARMLQSAQAIFWAGPAIEGFLIQPLGALPKSVRVIALADQSSLIRLPLRRAGWADDAHGHKGGGVDGHLWLDPENARRIVFLMRDVLVSLDPPHAEIYAKNAKLMAARLAALDGELRTELAPFRAKPFLVFHDAYQYFETRYQLNGRGALALTPEIQPGARTVRNLRRRLLAGDVECAFAEPQFEPKLLDAISEGTRVRRGTLDPEGAGLAPGPDLYFLLLKGLGRSFAKCLAG